MEDFLKLEFGVPRKLSLQLSKFDGTILGNLKECTIENIDVSLKEIWTMDIKCPKYIKSELSGDMELNEEYDSLEEEKFVTLTMNDSKAIFVVKEVSEDTTSGVKKCKCYNSDKMINKKVVFKGVTKQLVGETVENGKGIFNLFDESVLGWKLRHIDEKAKLELDDTQGHNKYRYFENINMKWHDFIKKDVVNAYEILPLFDSYAKKVDIYDINSYGENIGFVISNKNISKKIELNSDTKDLITKLNITGKEEIDLIGVNPLGKYVQNYDYFKPNMSPSLSSNIDKFEAQLEKLFVKWQLENELLFQQQVLLQEQTEKRIVKDEKIRILKARQVVALKEEAQAELTEVKRLLDIEIAELTLILKKIHEISLKIKTKTDLMMGISESMIAENIKDDKGIKIFSESDLIELNDYTNEESESQEVYFTKHALYTYAKKRIKEVSKPKLQVSIEAQNFIDDIQSYQGYDGYIKLGDRYYVLDSKGNKVEVTFLSYTYNPTAKSLSFNFSSEGLKSKEDVKSFSGIAQTISKNNKAFNTKKWEWNETTMQKNFVKDLLQNGLDAGITKIFAESNKNKVSIDENGIWLQNTENPDYMIVETASAIIISTDGLKTASTAIDATGIYAELLVGKIIASEKMYISNKNNDFRIDEDGIFVEAKKMKMKFTEGVSDIESKFEIMNDKILLQVGNVEKTLNSKIEVTEKAIKQEVENTKLGLETKIKTTADGITENINNTKLGLSNEIKKTAEGLDVKIGKNEQQIAQVKIDSQGLQTQITDNSTKTESQFKQTANLIAQKVGNTEFGTFKEQTANQISSKVSTGDFGSMITQNASNVQIAFGKVNPTNIVRNGSFRNGFAEWFPISNKWIDYWTPVIWDKSEDWTLRDEFAKDGTLGSTMVFTVKSNTPPNIALEMGVNTTININPLKQYTMSALVASHGSLIVAKAVALDKSYSIIKTLCTDEIQGVRGGNSEEGYYKLQKTFTTPSNALYIRLEFYIVKKTTPIGENAYGFINKVKVEVGDKATGWTPHPSEIGGTFVDINDGEGLTVRGGALQVKSKEDRIVFRADDAGYIYNEYGIGTIVKPGEKISVMGSVMADDKCSTLLRAFGLWHESLDSKYNLRIGSKSEIWFTDLRDDYQAIRCSWAMAKQFRTTYNNDAGVIIRENSVDSGTGRLWLNWAGGTLGSGSSVLVGDGMGGGSWGNLQCGSFVSHGTKNRAVKTKGYGTRLLGAYETPTPYFGDISRSTKSYKTINGECKVFLEEIFKETISDEGYQVFISKYGRGDIWVDKRNKDYFVVKSDEDIEFSWEIKAIQKGYEENRLEELDF